MLSIIRHRDGMTMRFLANGERRIHFGRDIVTEISSSGIIPESAVETIEEATARCLKLLSSDKEAKFYILDDEAKLISVMMDEERQRELTRTKDRKEFWIIAAFVFLLIGAFQYIAAALGGMDWSTAVILHFALVLGWWIQIRLGINNLIEAAVVITIIALQLSILFPTLNKLREQRRKRDAIQNQKSN